MLTTTCNRKGLTSQILQYILGLDTKTSSAVAATKNTRSQAVAKIADRTASQHLWGHVTSPVTWPFDSPYQVKWSLSLQPFSWYCAVSILWSQVWPFRVTWRHRSRDHLLAHMPFHIGGPLDQASISNGFGDIQRRM